MKFLAVFTSLVAVSFGRSFEENTKTLTLSDPSDVEGSSKSLLNRRALWNLFQGLIPSEYHDLAVQEQLYQNTNFQKDVFNLALKQLSLEVHTQIAKQNKLREFVICSCPTSTCGNNPVEVEDFRNELTPFFQEVKSTVELETALRALRLMKFSMDQIQRRYQQVVFTVDCSCPKAEQCRSALSPQMYDMISGKSDNILRNAYWQDALKQSTGFPNIMPQELIDSLQAAWSKLLENFFANVPPSWGWFGPMFSNNRTQTNTHSSTVSTKEPKMKDHTLVHEEEELFLDTEHTSFSRKDEMNDNSDVKS